MKLNKKREPIYTHGGARAAHINPEQQLRRSVMSCLLWEKEFYEDGETIVSRIASLVPQVNAQLVAEMAVEARTTMKLRHVPLLLVREMARHKYHKGLVAETLNLVIQRPDELTEFLAIYWKDGKEPLSAQVKKGLASAFGKFSEYQLSKWDKPGKVKLRDVLFLTHAKPKDAEQAALWKRLIDGELAIPDTWEVSLSINNQVSKKDKWTRLLTERKLGGLALIRNLKNMQEADVDKELIVKSLKTMNVSKILPFRFIAAAQMVPRYEEKLFEAMIRCTEGIKKFSGRTILVVDMSGSMSQTLSEKSIMARTDAAIGMGLIIRELCEDIHLYATAGNDYEQTHATVELPPRRGMALKDAFYASNDKIGYGGIFLTQVMDFVEKNERGLVPDRVIVLSDEQDCDSKRAPSKAKALGKRNYFVNMASAKSGIGYGPWTHIDGWSEGVIRYIQAMEEIQ